MTESGPVRFKDSSKFVLKLCWQNDSLAIFEKESYDLGAITKKALCLTLCKDALEGNRTKRMAFPNAQLGQYKLYLPKSYRPL